jgi:hypothetical protein
VGALMNVTVLFIAERGGRRKWGVWQRNDYNAHDQEASVLSLAIVHLLAHNDACLAFISE